MTQHLYHRGELIAVVRDNMLYFVANDQLGRPEQIYSSTDASLKWRATNTAFGRKIVTTDQIGGYQLGFPGQYHDEETGFAYNVGGPASALALRAEYESLGGSAGLMCEADPDWAGCPAEWRQ
jgi:hypothetical protein